jgi:hypothetical protein
MVNSGLYSKYLTENFPNGGYPDMPMIASGDFGSEMVDALLSHANLSESPSPPWVVSMSGIVLTNENDRPLYLVEFELIDGVITIYSAEDLFCRSDKDEPQFYFHTIKKLAEYKNMKATRMFIERAKTVAPEDVKRTVAFLREIAEGEAKGDAEIRQALEFLEKN